MTKKSDSVRTCYMVEPTHDFLKREVSRYLETGRLVTHLPAQRVKRGLTALPKPSDRGNEETDTIDWLSDAIAPTNE